MCIWPYLSNFSVQPCSPYCQSAVIRGCRHVCTAEYIHDVLERVHCIPMHKLSATTVEWHAFGLVRGKKKVMMKGNICIFMHWSMTYMLSSKTKYMQTVRYNSSQSSSLTQIQSSICNLQQRDPPQPCTMLLECDFKSLCSFMRHMVHASNHWA